MTQTEKIMNHLQVCGTITAGEALTEYGIMRLASRISDLKKKWRSDQEENGQGQESLRR